MTNAPVNKYLMWFLRIVPALILIQTLYFKFTAHPQSVKLFTILGMEPWGRIGTGIVELIAAILLLIPAFTIWGAIIAAGVMAGAVFFHITKIGIAFDGDYGLFTMAIITMLFSMVLIFILRAKLFNILRKAG